MIDGRLRQNVPHRVQCAAAMLVTFSLACAAGAQPHCPADWDYAFGQPGMNSGVVASFALHDKGDGPELYVGGSFTAAGGVAANRVARWTGSGWAALGAGLSSNECYALASYAGELYAAGYFDSAGGAPGTAKLARWNGTAWNAVGDSNLAPFFNQLWTLQVHDDGSGDKLYIGGNFQNLGNLGIDYIGRWDGEVFEPVGGSIGGAVPLAIFEITEWDDGTGNALYVGGRFLTIDGIPANRIAKWDGEQWHALGEGLVGAGVAPSVMAMQSFDDGTGEQLYVGGQAFTTAGGTPANRIARWDGSQWSPVGDGFADGIVWSLDVFDDGTGPALYAFGTFTASGDTPINRVARWDGKAWQPVSEGPDANLFASIVFDAGDGEKLYVGGGFTSFDGEPASRIVRFAGCLDDEIVGDLNGDGVVDVFDLLILLGMWGDCPAVGDCPADFNGDGTVDVFDLLIQMANWG